MQDEAVLSAIEYMWQNYHRQLTLDRLAAHVAYSKFYFLRRFKCTTGATPGQYLTGVRLARSKQMLAADSKLPITDVSLAVGYGSIGTFCARFRQGVGVTPGEYRAAHRGDSRQFFAFTGGRPEDDVVVEEGPTPAVVDRALGLQDNPADASTRPSGLATGNVIRVPSASGLALKSGQAEFSITRPGSRGWSVFALAAVPKGQGGGTPVVALGGYDDTEADLLQGVTVTTSEPAGHELPILTALPGLRMRVRKQNRAAEPADPQNDRV